MPVQNKQNKEFNVSLSKESKRLILSSLTCITLHIYHRIVTTLHKPNRLITNHKLHQTSATTKYLITQIINHKLHPKFLITQMRWDWEVNVIN